MTQVKRKGELLEVTKPVALSLVGKPANRIGFRIIRSETENGVDMVQLRPVMAGRQHRVNHRIEGLLAIYLPVEAGENDAWEVVEKYSLQEEFSLYRKEDGQLVLIRNDVDTLPAGLVRIDLGEGVMAAVAFERSEAQGNGVAVVSLEFDERYTPQDIKAFLADHGITVSPNNVEAVEGGHCVSRSVVEAGEPTHKVTLQEGVTAVIAQRQVDDIPAGVYPVVMEEAYGLWGWGQLDFFAMVADEYFTDNGIAAIQALDSLLFKIVLDSGLPLEERGALVDRALEQFSVYIRSLMAMLPKEVLLNLRASADSRVLRASAKTVEKAMNVKNQETDPKDAGAENVKTPDELINPESDAEKPAEKSAEDTEEKKDDAEKEEDQQRSDTGVTREEMEDMIKAQVNEISEAMFVRQEEFFDKFNAAIGGFTTALEKLVQAGEGTDEQLKVIADRVTALESATHTRSDRDDPEPPKQPDPFKGLFSGRRG